MERKKELIGRLLDLIDLIAEDEKQDYIDELTIVVKELTPLIDNLNLMDDIWWGLCTIIVTINKYPNLLEAVFELKQKQLRMKGLNKRC